MFKLCIFVAMLMACHLLVQARPQFGGGGSGMAAPTQTQMQQLKTIAKSCILRKDLMAIFFELITTPTMTFAVVKNKMNEKLVQEGLSEASTFIQQIVETQKQKRVAFLDCLIPAVENDAELSKAAKALRENLNSDDVNFDTRCGAFMAFIGELGPENKQKLHDCFQKMQQSGGAGFMGGRPGGGFMIGGPGGGPGGNGQMGGPGGNGQGNGQGGMGGPGGQGGMSGPMKFPPTCNEMAEMMSEFAKKLQQYQCPEGNNAAAPAGAARDAPAFEPAAPAPEN